MKAVVEAACQEMDVKYETNQIRFELYKLLLYETGGHFAKHRDTEKVKQ
jgi:hypothetical protein